MDIDMPEMDGLTCLSEMQKINPQIKFLISTGYGETIRDHCHCFNILSKPYSINELRNRIHETFNH